MADNYARTDVGSIYTDMDRGSEAGDLIVEMIPIIKAAQARHNFSQTDALRLIVLWEQIGEVLRSPDYHRQIAWSWLTTRGGNGGPNGPKTSDTLVVQLQRLRGATDGINVMARVLTFNGAETAMRDFVGAFRAKLGPKEKMAFDNQLMSQMRARSLSPAMRGD